MTLRVGDTVVLKSATRPWMQDHVGQLATVSEIRGRKLNPRCPAVRLNFSDSLADDFWIPVRCVRRPKPGEVEPEVRSSIITTQKSGG